MLFIFSTPVLIRHLWQLKTVVFLHWCLICAVSLFTFFKAHCLKNTSFKYFCHFLQTGSSGWTRAIDKMAVDEMSLDKRRWCQFQVIVTFQTQKIKNSLACSMMLFYIKNTIHPGHSKLVPLSLSDSANLVLYSREGWSLPLWVVQL
jgi:hypothetical protein